MYELIDDAIQRWARRHGLVLTTEFKDYEVRSVDVVDVVGNSCQIWIDPPKAGFVTVHVWPYAAPHETLQVPLQQIEPCLDLAYNTAQELLLKRRAASV